MLGLGLGLISLAGAESAIVDLDELAVRAAAESLGRGVTFCLSPDNGDERARTSRVASIAAALDCGDAERVFRHAGKHEAKHVQYGLHLWYKVPCDNNRSAAASARTYAAIERFVATASDNVSSYVDILEPEVVAAPSVESNDPELDKQAGHYGAINLFDAWDVSRGSADLVVQVLDSGLDTSHPDFQQNIWTNLQEICGNGVDDDNNGFVDDCHGYNFAINAASPLVSASSHGTHCAGTVSADTDNNVGVAGVAGGTPDAPGVKIMIAVGFADDAQGGFAEALIYGADNGARISSNSWGYINPGVFASSVLAAIDYYNDAQGVVVFAAGNDGSDEDYYPGFYDGSVTVAALENTGEHADFTNYGAHIDISAPGVGIYSTVIGGYGYFQGTSMACPHVAGVLALGWSLRPTLPRADLLLCLFETAIDIDALNPTRSGLLGAGLVDASAFIECVSEDTGAPTPVPMPCGACDHTLQLDLYTDRYPQDVSWRLSTDSKNSLCEDVDEQGGDYDQQSFMYSEVISQELCDSQSYTFTIFDSFGDGLCCAYGSGRYEVTLDGVAVASGDQYTSTESTTFTVPSAPTPSPTGACEDDDPTWRVARNGVINEKRSCDWFNNLAATQWDATTVKRKCDNLLDIDDVPAKAACRCSCAQYYDWPPLCLTDDTTWHRESQPSFDCALMLKKIQEKWTEDQKTRKCSNFVDDAGRPASEGCPCACSEI